MGRPSGALALAAALAASLAGGGLAGAVEPPAGDGGPFVVRREAAVGEPAGSGVRAAGRRVALPLPAEQEARLGARRSARRQGLFTGGALMRPHARLGILKRVGERWLPARGAPSRHAEILRSGPVDALALGELARTPAPEAAAAGAASVPGQDVIRVLVLRIDFLADRSGTQTTGDGRFDLSPPDSIRSPVDPSPHDSMYFHSHMEALKRYYETTTAGRLVVEWEVYPKADSAYHATDMADYGPWRISQDIFPIAYSMFHSFIAAADTQDTSIPWSQFDRVIIFHAGSDLQSDLRQDSPSDIPTFTIGLDDSLAIPVGDSTTKIYASAILPETASQDGYFAALNAVVAHENGHNIMGWRDVYDVYSGLPVCGEWTLMDTGNLVGSQVQVGKPPNQQTFFAVGILPPLADPYQRHLVYDDVPSTDPAAWGAVDSLSAPLVSNRVLKVPLSSEEYLLLENRQADLSGDSSLTLVRDPATGVILGPSSADSLEYDFLLPGSGVVVWQVDESVVGFDPPGLRADEFFSLNGNPDRRGLQIVEADGLDDLGDPNSPFLLGSPYDPYFIPNNSRLGEGTRPPLVTNSGTNPHATVEVLDSLRLTMRVRVSRDWAVAGWPVRVKPGKTGIDPLVFAVGPELAPYRVVYSAGDSAIHARRGDGGEAGQMGGDVLWRAPASLSPVAALGDPRAGAPVVAVYPDPATLDDSTWTTGGSWLAALDPTGLMLPGFPVRVPARPDNSPDWITAGPLVYTPGGLGSGQASILVGTRAGKVYLVSRLGEIGPGPGAWLPVEGGGLHAGAPILALAAYSTGSTAAVAAADSLGGVAITVELQPLELQAASGGAAAGVGRPGWKPLLAWVELNRGAAGTAQRGDAVPGPQLVVLDRASGAGAIYAGDARWAELRGVNAPLTRGIAAGDLDGDGFNEVVVSTRDGRVGFWNLSGSATPGWPREEEPEGFACEAAPLTARLGAGPALDIVTVTGSGRLFALGPDRKPLAGWPLATGAGQTANPALLDVDGDGSLELLIADKDSLLYAFALPSAPDSGAVWPVWGGDPGRTFSLANAPGFGDAGAGSPLVDGSVVCFPNPARRSPVTISFRLREAAKVVLTLFDASGRRVAELAQDGLASDNAVVWDAAGQAPGLYLGRLAIRGTSGREDRLLHIGVLK